MVRRLNKQQKEAIEHGQGPLIIIAGAGTGKTTVITERIKWLINQGFAKPAEILALTFTDKAAREMEERVDQAMPYGYTQMWISTFHSFCDRILRDEAIQIGLSPNFVLMTEAETLIFLREHLFDLPLDYFRPRGNPTKFLEGMLAHFNRLRDEDITPSEYLRWAKSQVRRLTDKTQKDKSSKIEAAKFVELAQSFKKYQALKIRKGVMDFADLISNTLLLFREKPNILQQYRKQFKYILVDEFQDTNIAQNELAILLAGKGGNITVCADDDQSIYKWRGAAISNVLQFTDHFPKAKIISLVKNYRSTKEILDRAYHLIQYNNPDRLEVKEKINKKLVPVRGIKGEKIKFIHAVRVENEAEAVAREIRKWQKKDYRWLDFAILVRANDHAQSFIQTLKRAGIPYQFLGPGRLLRQPEVKDLIAYLNVLNNFENDVALYKVLTMDIFALSARDLAAVRNFAHKYNLSLFEACEEVAQEESARPRPRLSQETKEKIAKIIKMIHHHLELIPKETAGQILYFFLEETGLLKKLTKAETITAERRALNIAKFFDKLKTYEAEHEDASVFPVVDWLNMKMMIGESPLAADIDWTEIDAVNILTIHSAKGLEFPVVFLVNLVSQRFPTIHRREQIPIPDELIKEILPSGDYHEQEERRLFYVGMTRARDRLYLTAANYYGEAKREKKISPFVYEALGLEIRGQRLEVSKKQLSFFDFKPTKKAPLTSKLYPLASSIYLSYSQIDTFNTCPLQYKYKHLLHIPVVPSPALSFGSSVHSALKDFYQMVLDKKKPKVKNLFQALKKTWSPLGYASKAHEKKMYRQARRILKDFYKKAYNPRKTPFDLEKSFYLLITPQLKIGGRIDRVDKLRGGKLEIIDYKTGKSKDQKEIDQDLQLTVYALAATDRGIYNKRPEEVILSFYYLDPLKKISTTRTTQQLNQAKKELIKKAAEIQKSKFYPTPGKHCDFCQYKLLCDAWK